MSARTYLHCDECDFFMAGMRDEDVDALRARVSRECGWVFSASRDYCDTCYPSGNEGFDPNNSTPGDTK